jgi:hypothetical protein
MHAAFNPNRLGAPTAVSFTFQVSTAGQDPPVLRAVELAYPQDLGLATSGLGLAACSPLALEESGPEACPANSRMGYGSAVVEIPFGPAMVHENVSLTLLAGPSPNGALQLLLCAVGQFPVAAVVVLSAQLEAGHLSITVPPIRSIAGGPYVALVQMHLTLGGHLTYYEYVHGRRVAYHPAGVGLPRRCPRGGFAFAATVHFLNGQHSNARTAVACPKRR